MKETKKPYVSPGIESERLDPPEAWACTIFGPAGSASGTWSGSDVMTSPIGVCP